MKMKDLKADYKSGIISKTQYIEEMHKIHQVLFEYIDLIKGTDIETIEISRNGVIMTSKINHIEMLNFDVYEKNESNIILQMINKNSIVFDVGANIGWFSLLIAKNIENVKVFSFEPIPNTYKILTMNVIENDVSNILLFNFGFSDEIKMLEFYYYPEISGNASMKNLSNRSDVQKIECAVTTLDRFAQDNNVYPDFIKCDVEGAELFVFEGGIETLKKSTPIVYTEMLRKWAAKFNYHPNQIISLFNNLNYGCYTAKEDGLRPVTAIDDDITETNFFFLHRVSHIQILNKFFQ